ncbi:hypothetical protein Q8A67_011893 [Cirrhinus molitorella]|uniref:Uncharacterized protein n=1 Tax=Cirrhinus molitorella TaxID=172907 RepID=A0AA88TMC3_9TELE|nr:hypothetical protein Q8A67_011893 [Cirrhinus molitorella]
MGFVDHKTLDRSCEVSITSQSNGGPVLLHFTSWEVLIGPFLGQHHTELLYAAVSEIFIRNLEPFTRICARTDEVEGTLKCSRAVSPNLRSCSPPLPRVPVCTRHQHGCLGPGLCGAPCGIRALPRRDPTLTSSCWDTATFPAKPGFIMCVCAAAPPAVGSGGGGKTRVRTKKKGERG